MKIVLWEDLIGKEINTDGYNDFEVKSVENISGVNFLVDVDGTRLNVNEIKSFDIVEDEEEEEAGIYY